MGSMRLFLLTCLILHAGFLRAVPVSAEKSFTLKGTEAGNSAMGSTVYPNGGMVLDRLLPWENTIYASRCAVVDPAGDYAYFSTQSNPPTIRKLDLSNSAFVATLPLPASFYNLIGSAVIDQAGDFAYFGDGIGNTIFKVDLATFTQAGSITLNTGEAGLRSAILDPTSNTAYFGTYPAPPVYPESPGRIVKVDLGTFTRGGAITLNSGEGGLWCGVIDVAGRAAYFGTLTAPGRIVKIDLTTFTRVGAITLEAGEDSPQSAVLDPEGGAAYFGCDAGVVKIDLATFTRVGRVSFNGHNSRSACIDREKRMGYISQSSTLYKIDLKSFTLVGSVSVHRLFNYYPMVSAILDPVRGTIHFGTYPISPPAPVVKMDISQKGFCKLTRFSLAETAYVQSLAMYSHEAAGNVRVGVYREDSATTRTLVWQSNSISNAATNSYVNIPVYAGTPAALVLQPGVYYFGWQVDTTADVPSYAPGEHGEGSFIRQDYGPFAPKLATNDAATSWTSTAERWTGYLEYGSHSAADPTWMHIGDRPAAEYVEPQISFETH